MNDLFDIKICGINNEICMAAALACKVEYVGLVFYEKSPRNVAIKTSSKLLHERNSHTKIVALTVNATDDFLNEIINNVKPDFLQLHGNENPYRCREIKEKFKLPIIKGVGIQNKTRLIKVKKQFEDICDILLFDAPSTNLPGGNGEKFNWRILREFKCKKKWMLAGGLNINNISEAINITKPPAIDISSGLETKKGVKNAKLIKDFVIKCRNI